MALHLARPEAIVEAAAGWAEIRRSRIRSVGIDAQARPPPATRRGGDQWPAATAQNRESTAGADGLDPSCRPVLGHSPADRQSPHVRPNRCRFVRTGCRGFQQPEPIRTQRTLTLRTSARVRLGSGFFSAAHGVADLACLLAPKLAGPAAAAGARPEMAACGIRALALRPGKPAEAVWANDGRPRRCLASGQPGPHCGCGCPTSLRVSTSRPQNTAGRLPCLIREERFELVVSRASAARVPAAPGLDAVSFGGVLYVANQRMAAPPTGHDRPPANPALGAAARAISSWIGPGALQLGVNRRARPGRWVGALFWGGGKKKTPPPPPLAPPLF